MDPAEAPPVARKDSQQRVKDTTTPTKPWEFYECLIKKILKRRKGTCSLSLNTVVLSGEHPRMYTTASEEIPTNTSHFWVRRKFTHWLTNTHYGPPSIIIRNGSLTVAVVSEGRPKQAL